MGPLEFVFGPRRPKGYVPPAADKIALTEPNRSLPQKSGKAGSSKEDTKTPGLWVAYKDRNGRHCWQNRVTGKWTYEAPDPSKVFQPPQQPVLIVQNPAPAPHVMPPGQPWVQPQPWNNAGGGPFPPSPVPIFIPPPQIANPNMRGPGEAKVFIPSPLPGGFQPTPWAPGMQPSPVMSPVMSPVPVRLTMATESNPFEADDDDEQGTWDRKYASDGSAYWVNTATGERKRQDPYY